MLNSCSFIGNLGQDPEMRTMAEGVKVANMSLAVTKQWKDAKGEKQQKTEWIRLVAWRGLAEICEKYIRKGQQVYAEGEMETHEYLKDNVKHFSTTINCSSIKMLGGRKEESQTATEAPPLPGNPAPYTTGLSNLPAQEKGEAKDPNYTKPEKDDLPF